MTSQYRGVRLFNVMMAFQSFAGQPLRAMDASSALTHGELDLIEGSLRKIAAYLSNEDPNEWPELHMLANDIEKWLRA